MSPLFLPLVLAVLAGVVFFIYGLIARRKSLAIFGSLAVVLLVGWIVLASIPLDPEEEFVRIFGIENRDAGRNIVTTKPFAMDGYFMSFEISEEQFDQRIRPHLSPILYTNFHFLRGQDLPSGWPKEIEESELGLHKETIGRDDVLLYFDKNSETVYLSVGYEKW